MKPVSSFTDVKTYDVKQDAPPPTHTHTLSLSSNRRHECEVPYLDLSCVVTSSVMLFPSVGVLAYPV
jgi:hypothetical protein